MKKPAKLCSPLIWPHKSVTKSNLPRFFVMSDTTRLPDPSTVFDKLPRDCAIILRHPDQSQLAKLAKTIVPKAHQLGLKVLISNNVRMALASQADGVHLSELTCRLGHWKRNLHSAKSGFIITAASHSSSALNTATQMGVHAHFLSPIFETKSHPEAPGLGLIRFQVWAQKNPKAVMALGGISVQHARRLRMSNAYGFGAIEAWQV